MTYFITITTPVFDISFNFLGVCFDSAAATPRDTLMYEDIYITTKEYDPRVIRFTDIIDIRANR